MDYVIFDLEWNNFYDPELKKGFNEIIEIGALKIDDKFNIVSEYNQLIKPKVSTKIKSKCAELTGITFDLLLNDGISFEKAISNFFSWSGDDVVFISWSDTDLRTLIENVKFFKNTDEIPEFKYYVDGQEYCEKFVKTKNNEQISLLNCSIALNIEYDDSLLHRALQDCYLTRLCIQKVFDSKKFLESLQICDADYFKRLSFKPYIIQQNKTDNFDVSLVDVLCPFCNLKMNKKTVPVYNSGRFQVACTCSNCNRKFWANIKAKQYYNKVKTSYTLNRMSKKYYRRFN